MCFVWGNVDNIIMYVLLWDNMDITIMYVQIWSNANNDWSPHDKRHNVSVGCRQCECEFNCEYRCSVWRALHVKCFLLFTINLRHQDGCWKFAWGNVVLIETTLICLCWVQKSPTLSSLSVIAHTCIMLKFE